MREKLLQRPHGNTRRQSDRLDTLSGQFRQLPAQVDGEMIPRIASGKTIGESIEIRRQDGFQRTNLLGIHACPSAKTSKAGRFANYPKRRKSESRCPSLPVRQNSLPEQAGSLLYGEPETPVRCLVTDRVSRAGNPGASLQLLGIEEADHAILL